MCLPFNITEPVIIRFYPAAAKYPNSAVMTGRNYPVIFAKFGESVKSAVCEQTKLNNSCPTTDSSIYGVTAAVRTRH